MKKHIIMAACLMTSLPHSLHAKPASDTSSVTEGQREEGKILNHFVDSLVLPAYRSLLASSQNLEKQVRAFSAAPTELGLDQARAAWRESRAPWEQSEAFLFGPVDSLGYDPALDSWPLDLTAFDLALPELADKKDLDMFQVDPALKGFHALEYLLFGKDNDKPVENFSQQELRYLESLASHQTAIAGLLLQSWTQSVDGQMAFAATFKSAGTPGNEAYPSQEAAIQEIHEAMVGIAEELAYTKVGEPLETSDPNLAESRFSQNSLRDFASNLEGIRLVYAGTLQDEKHLASLAAWIETKDPALHQRVTLAIETAQADLGKIPEPFVEAIVTGEGRKLALQAQASLIKLFEILDQDLRAAL